MRWHSRLTWAGYVATVFMLCFSAVVLVVVDDFHKLDRESTNNFVVTSKGQLRGEFGLLLLSMACVGLGFVLLLLCLAGYRAWLHGEGYQYRTPSYHVGLLVACALGLALCVNTIVTVEKWREFLSSGYLSLHQDRAHKDQLGGKGSKVWLGLASASVVVSSLWLLADGYEHWRTTRPVDYAAL